VKSTDILISAKIRKAQKYNKYITLYITDHEISLAIWKSCRFGQILFYEKAFEFQSFERITYWWNGILWIGRCFI